MPAKKKTKIDECKDCQCFIELTPVQGNCILNPPTVMTQGGLSVYPVVRHDCTACFQQQPKTKGTK